MVGSTKRNLVPVKFGLHNDNGGVVDDGGIDLLQNGGCPFVLKKLAHPTVVPHRSSVMHLGC